MIILVTECTRPGGVTSRIVEDGREAWAIELTPTATRLVGDRVRVGQLGLAFGFDRTRSLIEHILQRALSSGANR
jgi:hypothetical protein